MSKLLKYGLGLQYTDWIAVWSRSSKIIKLEAGDLLINIGEKEVGYVTKVTPNQIIDITWHGKNKSNDRTTLTLSEISFYIDIGTWSWKKK